MNAAARAAERCEACRPDSARVVASEAEELMKLAQKVQGAPRRGRSGAARANGGKRTVDRAAEP